MTDKTDTSPEAVEQAIVELRELTRCRCHEAYRGRGLHDPDCNCDDAEAVELIAARVAELEADIIGAQGQIADAQISEERAEAAEQRAAELEERYLAVAGDKINLRGEVATLEAKLAKAARCLLPFARIVDKQSCKITMVWNDGEYTSTYTDVLKPEDFYEARAALAEITETETKENDQ